MSVSLDALKEYKVVVEKLSPFGFVKEKTRYLFSKLIVAGQFRVDIVVGRGKKVSFKVFDTDSGEEYVLWSVLTVQGALVGRVRREATAILEKFTRECCEKEVYKEKGSLDLVGYILKKYGDPQEFLWERFPEYSIFRKAENKKWYCLIGTVAPKSIGLQGAEKVEIANFKVEPAQVPELLKRKGFAPAYHMNKKTWISVLLDGSVPLPEIRELLDRSYELAE